MAGLRGKDEDDTRKAIAFLLEKGYKVDYSVERDTNRLIRLVVCHPDQIAAFLNNPEVIFVDHTGSSNSYDVLLTSTDH